MNAILRRGLAALLCLFLLFPLAACDGGGDTPDGGEAYTLTATEDGGLYCEETGVTYRRAAGVYLPGRMSTRVYAVHENGALRDCYYRLGPDSAKDYLVLAEENDYYPYYFIVADGYEMPSLTEMDPSEVWICDASAESFWADANVIDKVRNAERANFVVAAWRDGEAATLPLGAAEVCVQLIFRSEVYTELYYYCTYYSFGEGECYLYEFETDRCVRVADDLFEGYSLSFDE